MKFKYIIPAVASVAFLGLSTSCVDDLDVTPIDPSTLMTPDYDALLNKCYAHLALSGQETSDGNIDIDDLDGGTSGLIRQLWNSQELTSDEAVCGWGDAGIDTYVSGLLNSEHPMLNGLYNRLYVAITTCNYYLQTASDYNATYTAEVRALRAYYYSILLDGWGGNVPFATTISSDKPKQTNGPDLYAFIEEELLDAKADLLDAAVLNENDANYGRINKAAADMLLARLYLNAEVYTGTAQWQKASDAAKRVIDLGVYNLSSKPSTAANGQVYTGYQKLFMGDNGTNGATEEAIFSVKFEGSHMQTWGGAMFLMASTWDGDMKISDLIQSNNTSEAWGGNRATSQLASMFSLTADNSAGLLTDAIINVAGDERALFCSEGRKFSTTANLGDFKYGYGVTKYHNNTLAGTPGSHSQFPDIDIFVIRYAEALLTYAEAQFRLGNTAEALAQIQALQARANVKATSNHRIAAITDGHEILDEWCREFYFEGRRRTDLIRWGLYTGSAYLWEWKGGVANGTALADSYKIFPIPASDLNANSNLKQNPGY
ncbi:MAG: RagB/SusD family nutrient uptake outer membrane protein [Bacteroidia bacterium]|nr:RagB/SusD family nutrient uptake outer membrane protein [Bacteroidia bacterium]